MFQLMTFSTVSFEREVFRGIFQRATTRRHLANTRRTILRRHSQVWSAAQAGREVAWRGGRCSHLRQPRGPQGGPGRCCRCGYGVSILRSRTSLPPVCVRAIHFVLSKRVREASVQEFRELNFKKSAFFECLKQGQLIRFIMKPDQCHSWQLTAALVNLSVYYT